MDGGVWKSCEVGHEVIDLVKEIQSRHNPNATG